MLLLQIALILFLTIITPTVLFKLWYKKHKKETLPELKKEMEDIIPKGEMDKELIIYDIDGNEIKTTFRETIKGAIDRLNNQSYEEMIADQEKDEATKHLEGKTKAEIDQYLDENPEYKKYF